MKKIFTIIALIVLVGVVDAKIKRKEIRKDRQRYKIERRYYLDIVKDSVENNIHDNTYDGFDFKPILVYLRSEYKYDSMGYEGVKMLYKRQRRFIFFNKK